MAMLQPIIDRRLSGKNKSIGNRERFLRRYTSRSARRSGARSSGRGIRDIEQGEDITLPKRTSPSRCSTMARAASARWCIPAIASTSRATASSGRRAAVAAGSGNGQAGDGRRARTTSSSR